MNKKALEVQRFLTPHQKAVEIADKWSIWNNLREKQRERWREIDAYIHATSTLDLMEDSAWDHTTHIPIVSEIYEDLVAIMNDTVIPHEDWLGWRPYDTTANSAAKRNTVLSYIKNRHELNGFNTTINQLLADYVRYGNAFVMTTAQVNADGYIGPVPIRISPYDIVFNPTAARFEDSPKIVRQVMDLGQFKMFCEEQEDVIDKETMQRVLDRRGGQGDVDGSELDKTQQYLADGFGSARSYYFESGMVELLWFYGDIYDQNDQELYKKRKIVVVDRCNILIDEEEDCFIRHAPYRQRPDNLWAQGALDSIVGMNYQINHRENSKSDAIDRFIHPDRLFVGDVEEIWDETTGQYKYLAPENGLVRDLTPDASVLSFNSEIDTLTLRARSAARLPLQLAGFRTPGEKTAFEVQSLNEGAFRGFINKAEQFEINLLEPMVRDEVVIGRDNLSSALQVATQDEEGVTTMLTITSEDLKSNGTLVPYGARRFKRELQQMNMIYQLSNSQLGQYIGQHINTFSLAKTVEKLGGFDKFSFIDKFAAVEEQREAQSLQATSEEMQLQELQQRQMEDEL